MILEIQVEGPELARKLPFDVDRKLLSLAYAMDLRFGGYQPIGRGYRMHFVKGTVGQMEHFHIPRQGLKKFICSEVQKMKR